MKVIIVGFKVTEDNSTFYKKLDVFENEPTSIDRLQLAFRHAIAKSDFISVRVNRGK